MRRYRSWLAVTMFAAAGAVSLASPAQPPATPAAQRPTFRTGVNYVRADVYPTTDGKIVRDLRPEEFELREDGALQKLDSVRFVDPGPPTPQAVRVEPNSVAESRAAAADPRARLFIIFVDTYHIHWTSSFKAHLAFVEMLGQGMGEHDLVGVMTPEMSAASVTFGRRTTVIEEVLRRHFDLSRTPDAIDLDPEDRHVLRLLRPWRPGCGDGLTEARDADARRAEGPRELRGRHPRGTEGDLLPERRLGADQGRSAARQLVGRRRSGREEAARGPGRASPRRHHRVRAGRLESAHVRREAHQAGARGPPGRVPAAD